MINCDLSFQRAVTLCFTPLWLTLGIAHSHTWVFVQLLSRGNFLAWSYWCSSSRGKFGVTQLRRDGYLTQEPLVLSAAFQHKNRDCDIRVWYLSPTLVRSLKLFHSIISTRCCARPAMNGWNKGLTFYLDCSLGHSRPIWLPSLASRRYELSFRNRLLLVLIND